MWTCKVAQEVRQKGALGIFEGRVIRVVLEGEHPPTREAVFQAAWKQTDAEGFEMRLCLPRSYAGPNGQECFSFPLL